MLMKKVNFDAYSVNYDTLMQEQHAKFGDIAYYSEYKAKITKALCADVQQARILEYGCGIGRNLSYLQSAFEDSSIFGFDISKESLEIARIQNPTAMILNQDELLKYENYFDIIFIAGVYHHIAPNLRNEVTKNILKLLKQNGKIIIFEHNPYNPITRRMVSTCVFDTDAVLLTKSELTKLFKLLNFDCVKSGYALFVPPRLKKITFIEKPLRWLPLGGQYYSVFQKHDAK